MVATAPSVPIKTAIGGIKGNVHGGRGPVVGANVYLYSPSLTGYGGSGIAASTLNASTPLLSNSVPSTCGAGATATAVVDTNPADSTYQQITAINVVTGGAGYYINGVATPPTVTITDPTGTGATATANLGATPNGSGTPTSGWVQNISFTPGSGYTAPVVTITPSSTSACQDANGNYYVNSDQNGNFALSGDYTCTAGLPVYAYTTGGDAGSGAGGDGAFMSVLGICPASGNFATTLPYVNINELTTVAAAYALAGFATNPTHIGVLLQTSAPATQQTLEMTDLTNAFNTAGNIYNVGVQKSSAPTTTTNGSGTLPATKLNTLADILANCVDSTYINFACETLLSYTPNQTDTAGAAIYIAQHPYTNASKIFALATANGAPWQPALTAAPTDWTVSIIYTGGGLTTSVNSSGDLDYASHIITVDATGNIWVAGGAGGNVLSEFSPLGVPLSGSTGFTNSALNGPASATLDAASANVWLANSGTTTLSVYNIAGGTWNTITPVSGSTSELNEPNDVGFDGSGNIWVASPNNDDLIKLTSAGTYVTKGSNTNYVAYPLAVAIEPGATGNVWEIGEGSKTSYKYAPIWTNAMVLSAEPKTDEYLCTAGAVDGSGNAWVANYEYYTTKITSTGGTATNYQISSGGYYIPEPSSVAVDGAENIWFNDFANGYIIETNNSGANQVGNYGFVPAGEVAGYKPGSAPPTGYIQPYSLVIDGSGNVWFEELGVAAMQEMVGVAAPVVTPLAFATANSLYGVRP
jgi:hypothetical protein